MDAAEKLFDAARKRLSDEQTYSQAERQLEMIALLWSAYLGRPVTKREVCELMVLLKVARAQCRHVAHEDDYVDICGYAVLAFEKTGELEGGNV